MRSYQDTAWWRDDITPAQRSALRVLREKKHEVFAGDLRGVRLPTLRALHRFGLVRAESGDLIRHNTRVAITQSGREAISDEPVPEEKQ